MILELFPLFSVIQAVVKLQESMGRVDTSTILKMWQVRFVLK